MKALVAGWFSFEQMGASAGDLLVRDLVCEWLEEAGRDFEVALAPPFEGGVDWREVDPAIYSELVFACGPFGNGPPVDELLARFAGRRMIGVNLTMLDSLERWNPFDLLLERDSSRTICPDLAFGRPVPLVPVVGVVLIDSQPEYRELDLHDRADETIRRVLTARDLAPVRIDTRLDVNTSELRTPAAIESLIARMDAIVTTRLHGMVLALKQGVPAVAIDTVAGGAKVGRQAATIGWPVVLQAETLTDDELAGALDWCLADEARVQARACGRRAATSIDKVKRRFLDGLTSA